MNVRTHIFTGNDCCQRYIRHYFEHDGETKMIQYSLYTESASSVLGETQSGYTEKKAEQLTSDKLKDLGLVAVYTNA